MVIVSDNTFILEKKNISEVTDEHSSNAKVFQWNEFSGSPLNVYVNKNNNTYTLNSFTNVEVVNGFVVRNPTSIKSAGFWSQHEASCVSSHTTEL